MKVIFLKDVKNTGKINEVKEVADGFARNFLIPKKLALAATQKSIQNTENIQKKHAADEEREKIKTIKLFEQLKDKAVSIHAKEKDGKLFGSITAKEIARELKNQGIEIPQKSVILKKAIRRTGTYKISVGLENGIEADFNLIISGEK